MEIRTRLSLDDKTWKSTLESILNTMKPCMEKSKTSKHKLQTNKRN